MTVSQRTSGNLNDVRAYPLADDASRRADNGDVLPESLINDCHIWWPDIYGEVAFVASVTVSPAIMTMTIAAKRIVSGVVTLLAAVQIPRPAVAYDSYPLQVFQPGVSGWVSPGNIAGFTNSVRTWLFSTPEQSKLLPRLAQPYPSVPVTSIGEEGNEDTLTGRVRFISGRNITLEEDYRYVDGLYTRAIVAGLDEERLPELYEQFAGPCGSRPESGNCSKTTIRTINGVVPDCNGILHIDIDEANGVLEGRIDITDAVGGNAALYTPIEYADVCDTVGTFDPIPDDLCDSSLSGEPMESSEIAPGPDPGEALSSSFISFASVEYNFDSPDEVYDFAAFSNKNFERDYEIEPTADGGEHRLMWRDGSLILPVNEESNNVTRVVNTVKSADMRDLDDWAEVEATIRFSQADILAEEFAGVFKHQAEFRIGLTSGGLIAEIEDGAYEDRAIRLQVSMSNISGVVRVSVLAHWFGADAAGNRIWNTEVIAGEPTIGGSVDLDPTLCAELVSSSIQTTGSSSSCYEQQEDEVEVTVRMRLTVSDIPPRKGSSSSIGGLSSSRSAHDYKFDVELEATVDDGIDPALLPTGARKIRDTGEIDPRDNVVRIDEDGDWSQLKFFEMSAARTRVIAGSPFQVVPIIVDDAKFTAKSLLPVVCDEIDFEASPDRVSYLNQYWPDDGWSADFSVRRSFEQFRRFGSWTPEYPSVGVDDELSLPYQFLTAGSGTSHKYATLKCQESSLDEYVYSAAFKYTGNNAKYGILLGYQGGENEVFWAVVIDPKQQQITYGVHYAGFFQPLGWSPLPPESFDWLYDWHRLVVRIDSGFTVRAWVDPIEMGGSSSSSNLTKTIPINYSSPQYVVTPIQAWDENLSGVPQNEFADGSPGIYVFDGEARVAEFTVSPVDQDIVVPNKVLWLNGL